MENLLSIFVGGGVFAFGSLWIFYVIMQKFPSLKNNSFFKWINEALMVAADKSSMSGKTKKARDYGIPVISVAEFLDLI